MKNILSIALCATAIAAFGDEIVVSTADVGIYPVASSTKNTLIAVSLHADDGQNISVSNLVKTANLTVGDKLYAFKDGLYEGWTLGSDKKWQKAEKKYTYNGLSGTLVESGTAASDATAVVGSGIWLVRASDTPGSFTIYLTGKPVDTPTTTIAAGKVNLVGNPSKNDVTLKAEMFANAAVGDSIQVPGSGTLTGRATYTYVKNKKTSVCSWRDASLNEGLPTISANTGFWYVSKGAQGITITWPKN